METDTTGQEIKALAEGLTAPHWPVRERAVVSLAAFGTEEALAALGPALNDPVFAVRAAAFDAFADSRWLNSWCRLLGLGQDPAPVVEEWLRESIDTRTCEKGLNLLHYLVHLRDRQLKAAPRCQALIGELTARAKGTLALEKLQPYCRRCLRRFARSEVKTGLFSRQRYCCCIVCGGTEERYEGVATAVAVFDAPWPEPLYREGDTMFINMLMRDRKHDYIVDYEVLEIRATASCNLNEELKHFLLSSFNDPSMHRQKLKSVTARLVNRPLLNQNSLNLLKVHLKGYEGEATLQV